MPVLIGTAIATALGLGVIGTAIVVGATQLAFAVGIALIAGALTARSSPLPTPTDGQAEIRQPLSPRTRSYGTVRVGGVLFWFQAEGRELYKGITLNHGRISEIVSFHVDENQVDIDVNGIITTSPYDGEVNRIVYRLGVDPETTYTELEDISGILNLRGDGVATMLGIFVNPTNVEEFQNTYPSGQPELRATINASVVYDPRDDDQVVDDESTWQFSDNPVVCLMDYITHRDGYGIPWEKVEANLDQWIEAMDICDELVALNAGGFTRKYRVAGTYRLVDTPRDVVAKFESICDGRVWVKRDGSIGISVGKIPTDMNNIVHLSDGQITGYEKFTRGQDQVKAIQGIRAEYMSPAHDYREYEAEPWPTAADVLALDEDRVAALDMLWAPSNSQARRLMKRAYLRATATWHGTVHLNAAVLRLIDERYCRLTVSELGITDQLFEINRFEFEPGGPSGSIDVTSIDDDMDEWDPTEEGSIEVDVLSIVGDFSKTGTTIDLLGEAGAEIGDYCVIAMADNGTAFPTAPTDWDTLSASLGAGTAVAGRILGRLIDGTETNQTVNGASGPIIVVRYRGITDIQVHEEERRQEATNGFTLTLSPAATPYTVFAMACANSNFDEVDWLDLQSNDLDKLELDEYAARVQGSITMHVEALIYLPGEEPPAGGIDIHMNSDQGSAQQIQALNLLPG